MQRQTGPATKELVGFSFFCNEPFPFSNPHLYKVLLEILAGDSEAHGDPAPLAPKIECSEDETCISLLQKRVSF